VRIVLRDAGGARSSNYVAGAVNAEHFARHDTPDVDFT